MAINNLGQTSVSESYILPKINPDMNVLFVWSEKRGCFNELNN